MKLLIFKALELRSSLLVISIGAHTRNKQTSRTKKRSLNKRKALKEHTLKGRARSYDQKSVGNIKFRLKMRKICLGKFHRTRRMF